MKRKIISTDLISLFGKDDYVNHCMQVENFG